MNYKFLPIASPTILQRCLCAFLCVFCAISCLFAQQDYSLETVPNVRLQNRQNHVSNPDDILSTAYTDSINYVLNALEDSIGVEVAVVAITGVGDNDVRTFASDLFNAWGIGKKGEDNGLLILLVTKPEQRAVVFETGYGLEGILPDATCFSIQQHHMLPAMKEGNYSLGMYKGIQATANYLYDDYNGISRDKDSEEYGFWETAYLLLILALVLGGLVLVFYVLPIWGAHFLWLFLQKIFRKIWPKKCPKCGKRTFKLYREEITKEATTKTEGIRTGYYVCKSCGYEAEITSKYIKRSLISLLHSNDDDSTGGTRRRRSSSHSSSSRSSRGGGSWGGGSSGGGGSISRF